MSRQSAARNEGAGRLRVTDGAAAREPEFPHSAYGVQLSTYGEEGGMIAPGRVDPMRFIAACHKIYRTAGEALFLDGADAADALEVVEYCWLIPVPVPDGTPGARLYTVAEW